jgi:acetyltransferase-like isoleucine patch superfamily enzyme
VREDRRPYIAKRAYLALERAYTRRFVAPQFDQFDPDFSIVMRPWYLTVHGHNISAGKSLHVITAKDRRVGLTTWGEGGHGGRIKLGDYVLLCPGVRVDSASRVVVGNNTMLAAGAYLTDADWHDIYDRTRSIGNTAPIVLEDNVWIGDGATVCKGVTIGENTVIGTRSVVTHDMPANVIAAGNPARVIRKLGDQPIRTRETLLADAPRLVRETDNLNRYLLGSNTTTGWLRTLIKPSRGD